MFGLCGKCQMSELAIKSEISTEHNIKQTRSLTHSLAQTHFIRLLLIISYFQFVSFRHK